MNFDIPSIPDTNYEPKINYKALDEIANSRNEYLTMLRDAVLSIDKQQHEVLKQLSFQKLDSDKQHKQSMRKANEQIFWAVVAAFIALLTLIFTFFPNFALWIKHIFD